MNTRFPALVGNYAFVYLTRLLGGSSDIKNLNPLKTLKSNFYVRQMLVARLPISPAFATWVQTGDIKLQHLHVSAWGVVPTSRACIPCHLWGRQPGPTHPYTPLCDHWGPQSNKQHHCLGPQVEKPTPEFSTNCQNFPSRPEPQWCTVFTCLMMGHVLAAFPSCATSLLPTSVLTPWGFLHLPKKYLHMGPDPRVRFWENPN